MEDMEQYKKVVKENIEVLINRNELEEAKKIIREYEEVVSKDEDIYSFKAVVAMMESDMDEAERVLKEGLALHETSFDLLYNLGYLYESVNNKEAAVSCYKKSIINANNENEEEVSYNSLINLGLRGNKNDVISNIISENYYEEAVRLDKIGNKSDAAIYYGNAYKYSTDKKIKAEIYSLFNDNKTLKNIFNVACESSKKRFIILSSCRWMDIYQRMHHISRALVKLGNEVIYIAPTTSANTSNEKITISNLNNYSVENVKIIDGVKVYSPISAVCNGSVLANNYTSLVQKLLDTQTDSSKTIIVTYMPYQVDTINALKGKFLHIYDCVDDHSDLDYAFWANKQDVVWEQELMDCADAITTTATSLYLQRVALEKRKNVYCSRNAVNEGDFIISEGTMPEDLRNIPEPRIVYTGAIYDWFDKELFYDVVKSNPDKSFVIIGFGNDKILNEKCDNLFILGPKKHNELKLYLKYCQVSIIPFRDDIDLIVNCDPIKQYEYIACGLPVITTYMPEAAIDKINTFLANTKESFNEAIERSLKFKTDNRDIENFLIENSWNSRAALLCNIADNKISNLEKDKLIREVQNKLDYICDKYNSSIFQTLKGISLSLDDNIEFEKNLEDAYNKKKYKYIERQYLNSLFINKKMDKFIEVVKNSKHISDELKEELLCVEELSDNKRINIVSNICIGRIKKAILLLNELKDKNVKEIYKVYIRMLLGEDIEFNTFTHLKLVSNCSIFGNFINEKMDKEKLKIEEANRDPFISVIIPTRNSADVLRYALMTCIEQNYDKYEIVISDNSSPGNDETKKLVEELNCDRIRYFRTPEEYAMIENYEFAYDKARGEYMIIIGSDDGLLLHCLETLGRMIKELNKPLSISWDLVAYGWPKVGINSIRNGLFIPYPTSRNTIKYTYYDESALKAVLNFEARYSILPMFYYNSIIKRELAEEAKRITGKLFYASPPDVSTGIIFAYLQKKYIHVNMPMSIGGSSQNSNGITGAEAIYKNNIDNEAYKFEAKKIKKLNMDSSQYDAPYFAVEEGAVIIAATIAQKLFLKDRFEINRDNFYKSCTKYLFEDENFGKKKNELYSCIRNYGNKSLIKWYENNYLNNKDFLGYYNYQLNQLVAGYRENGGLALDASKFNVFNVFEAAKLYRNIVSY